MTRAVVFYDGAVTSPRSDHPEGVAVHPDGSVWCGGEAGQIYRITADGQELEVVADTGGFILGVAFAPGGDHLYACDQVNRAAFRVDTRTGALERFADGVPERRFRIPNAVVVASDGRVYVSDSHHPDAPGPEVFRFAPDGSGELWYGEPLWFANGLALWEDGTEDGGENEAVDGTRGGAVAAPGPAVYVAESLRPGISRIRIRPDGTAGERETVVELPGIVPDGLDFGPDGRLYVGCYEPSQVVRIDLGVLRGAEGTRGAGVKETKVEDVRGGDASVEVAGVKDAGVKDVLVKDAGVKDAGVKDAPVRDAEVKDALAKDVGVEDVGVEARGGDAG